LVFYVLRAKVGQALYDGFIKYVGQEGEHVGGILT
jgi:hypothetical protein